MRTRWSVFVFVSFVLGDLSGIWLSAAAAECQRVVLRPWFCP